MTEDYNELHLMNDRSVQIVVKWLVHRRNVEAKRCCASSFYYTMFHLLAFMMFQQAPSIEDGKNLIQEAVNMALQVDQQQ